MLIFHFLFCVHLSFHLSPSLPPSLQAFVISFTSDLIPRIVYQYMYSPNGSMYGFIDHTLSYFNVSNFRPGTMPLSSSYPHDVMLCRWVLTHTHTHTHIQTWM